MPTATRNTIVESTSVAKSTNSRIEVLRASDGSLWVPATFDDGTNSGWRVYRSTNGGTTWAEVTQSESFTYDTSVPEPWRAWQAGNRLFIQDGNAVWVSRVLSATETTITWDLANRHSGLNPTPNLGDWRKRPDVTYADHQTTAVAVGKRSGVSTGSSQGRAVRVDARRSTTGDLDRGDSDDGSRFTVNPASAWPSIWVDSAHDGQGGSVANTSGWLGWVLYNRGTTLVLQRFQAIPTWHSRENRLTLNNHRSISTTHAGVNRYALLYDGSNAVAVYATTGHQVQITLRDSGDLTTTHRASVALPTGWAYSTIDLLLAARLSDGRIVCVIIDYTVSDGRPNVQYNLWTPSSNTWGSWDRFVTDTDWATDVCRTETAWTRYPPDNRPRLTLVRESTTSRWLYHYELNLNLAPTQPTWVSPPTGTVADVGAALTLDWDFADPDIGDTQSAYTLRRRVGTTTDYRTSTGWDTTESAATKLTSATSAHTLAVAWAAATDADHYYAVKTWDAEDLGPSPWSAETRVQPDTPPTVTVTAPTNNATVVATVDVTWTATSQSAYQLRALADDAQNQPDPDTVLLTTGKVIDDAARTASLTFTENDIDAHVELTVWSQKGLAAAEITRRVLVRFATPPTPTVTAAADTTEPAIKVDVSWTAPVGTEPAVTRVDIWRRQVGDTDDGIRVGTPTPTSTNATSVEWHDYSTASGVAYQYQAVLQGDNDTTSRSAWVT